MVGRHRASECDMAAHPAEVGGPLRNEEPNRFCVRVDAPRSAAMKRGSELSWATTENPITAGTECSYKSPVVVLRGTLRALERQHPYARPAFINRQKRASLDVLTMRLECLGDDAHRSIGEQVLSSDLHDAWRGSSASSEDCREVEIVGNEDEIVPMRVRQDLGVGGGRSTHGRPMDSLEPVLRQPTDPAWREVHVHDQFHGRRSGTSTSSARQAA